MKSLHVWLLTGVLAAAACKPAVRDGSTLQSGMDNRDERMRKILIWGGATAVAGVSTILGIKYWSKIKKFPKESAARIKKAVSDAGSYLDWSNHVLRKEFNNAFPKKEWEDIFGVPFDSKARSALIDHINVRKADAIEAVRGGKSVDDVLADDSLRVLNKEDLSKRLREIYDGKLKQGQNYTNISNKMIREVEGSDVSPTRLKKRLEGIADKIAAEAQPAT